MTDNEIVKALECCHQVNGCDRCPLHSYSAECEILNTYALDLIKRQKAEIEKLQHENSELEIELKAMRGAANSYKAEVERLKTMHTLTE
jgi:predicted RNase H-like nuclease (RuvC/YqgF family)